jgi:PST family polysaccharide transporter
LKSLSNFLKNLLSVKSSLIAVALRALSALALGKWIAILFGPYGTLIFGQIMNLFGVFSTLSYDGLSKGMIKNGASEINPEKASAWVQAALQILLLLMSLAVVLIYAAGMLTDRLLPLSASPAFPVLLLCFFLLSLSYFLGQIFLVWQKSNLQAICSALLSGGGIAGFALARWFGAGLMSAMIWMLLGQALAGISGFLYFQRFIPRRFIKPSSVWVLARPLLHYVLALSSAGFIQHGLNYLWVQWAMGQSGSETMGIWMAMNRLADMVNIPVLAIANTVLLPRLSARLSDEKGIREVILPVFQNSFGFIVIFMLLLFLVYPQVLHLFYSSGFNAEPSWTVWQLAGDVFKSSSYFISILMLVMGHTRFFFILEIGSVLFLMGCSRLLLPQMGTEAYFLIHFFRYLIYWLLIVMRYRRYLI